MLKKDEFINFILEGQIPAAAHLAASPKIQLPSNDLMSFGFDVPETTQTPQKSGTSFAQRLLVAANFGLPEMVQTKQLIRGEDAVARYLPDRAFFWPKTQSRPYQTLLFEADINNKDLLAIPAFRGRKMSHLDIVEDALARMVSEALEGFQKGGEGVKADVRQGKKEETLCLVSIRDERESQAVRLVCFGTVNAKTRGLETFHLTEQTRYWDPQLAKDHLGLLYERQFKKLGSAAWQEAFTTSEEREQAEKLLKVCSKESPSIMEIQENVLTLLDTIAKGFGLRKKSGHTLRMQAFDLPADHDIGIDPEELTSKHAGMNPFGGVTLRDEKNRLLGYIVYPLKKKEDAARLRCYLEKNNRFHNVLVVFPDCEETILELWQGMEQLSGKLHKGRGFEGAAEVVSLLSRFFVVSKAKVRNPTELAQELAYRARYLRRLAIKELEAEKTEGPLRDLYKAFKEALVHDQTETDFADAFAQTITYGLLTSRWIGNDRLVEGGERFTRQNALKYLPSTSNFLGDLFKTALSVKLDEQRGRLLWLVDDIADLLDRIDVSYVFGIGDKDSDQATDPVIHFYEPFIAAYDNELRNKRGVFFTPRPVVSYIVRSIHELIQVEFGLEDGLASTATWGDVQNKFSGLVLPDGVNSSDLFICILDPATGTGTFLYECIEIIELTMKEKWRKEFGKDDLNDPRILSKWCEYVPINLLPKLYGYELMMASYSIAHLKLAFKLGETGYKLVSNDRIQVYLTNTLESPCSEQQKLEGVMPALAHEAQAVNAIKRHQHFTVLMGNPPYSHLSSNLSPEAMALVEPYKYIDGVKIIERGALSLQKNLQDDYIKFIRFTEQNIEFSKVGIVGLVTNNSYLDSRSFRGMRFHLSQTFNKGFIYDLHGSGKKEEIIENSNERDANVFDIMQGVAIALWIHQIEKTSESVIQRTDLLGTRDGKYNILNSHSVTNTTWGEIELAPPFFPFVQQDMKIYAEYKAFISIKDVLPLYSSGIKTHRDDFAYSFSTEEAIDKLTDFTNLDLKDQDLRDRYGLKDTNVWSLPKRRKKVNLDELSEKVRFAMYRPFDTRLTCFSDDIIELTRSAVMSQMINGDNIALLCSQQQAEEGFRHVFCTRLISDWGSVSNRTRESTSAFPLFINHPVRSSIINQQHLGFDEKIHPNISPQFLTKLGSPEKAFYYVYSMLHSQSYRTRYAAFLRSDFPRVPLVSNLEIIRLLVGLGKELVTVHLLETFKVDDFITHFSGKGDNLIAKKPIWKENAVWINQTQYFDGVSEDVWNFRIGCYQVCEKWLKDRKGRSLSQDDISHYQKIIVALNETIRLMTEIDSVIDSYGGWPSAFQTTTEHAK